MLSRTLTSIPEICGSEISGRNQLIAMGSYSDIYLCNWKSQSVVIKKLRIDPRGNDVEALKIELGLAMDLHHPNIVS